MEMPQEYYKTQQNSSSLFKVIPPSPGRHSLWNHALPLLTSCSQQYNPPPATSSSRLHYFSNWCSNIPHFCGFRVSACSIFGCAKRELSNPFLFITFLHFSVDRSLSLSNASLTHERVLRRNMNNGQSILCQLSELYSIVCQIITRT